jgi:REP element-mobilizing transposase RayT
MARSLRIEYPGAVYHVTARGNAQQTIFLDERDREDFLLVLRMMCVRFNCIIHAYCLIDNHYHILMETPDGNHSGEGNDKGNTEGAALYIKTPLAQNY